VPFLRVIRDKRGYETTYLMDWYHEAGRQRSRVLYAFRGPGGVRVGRTPLESATMRELEARYPDVPFDWKAIFAERQVIESGPDLRRRRPRRDDAPAETVAQPPKPAPKVEAQPPVPHPVIPAELQGDTPADRIAFLAEWYPKVRERVERRTTDPARRDALLTLAERLDPSAWDVTADLTEPMAHAAEALERLSRVLTRRRRRSGKRRTAPEDASAAAPTPALDSAAAEVANLRDELEIGPDADAETDSAGSPEDEPES
jgi:hypothetical protein